MTRIFKFGGASVKDAAAIRNLKSIITNHIDHHLVVIISAMGKTTNALEEIAGVAYHKTGDYFSNLDKIKAYHDSICDELDITKRDSIFSLYKSLEKELDDRVRNWYEYLDAIVSYGELLSTTLISTYISLDMEVKWLDARNLIATSDHYGEAKIDWKKTEEQVKKKIVSGDHLVITQGYIGRSAKGTTTTLGREGSDFTASIIANVLQAESMTVWKDVPGIMNADPKLMEKVELFETLSYREITEMTYYGAKVIHPKTILPLAQKNIPLFVRSFIDSDKKGTLISGEENNKVPIPTFILKFDQLVVTLRVKDHSFMDERKLVQIFTILDQYNVKLNLMQISALTFTFCFDAHSEKLAKVREQLREDFILTYNEELNLASIKNYTSESVKLLPECSEIIIEQRSRSVYHRLFRS